MKKILFLLVILVSVFIITSCAAISSKSTHFINGDTRMEKRGEDTNTVYFLLFGSETYPSAERVARENGITQIATVEKYWKLGVFGLWINYTTIVTGS